MHFLKIYTLKIVPTISVVKKSDEFPDVPVTNKKTIHKYVNRLWTTGSTLDSIRICRRYMLSEEKLDGSSDRMRHLQEKHLFGWTQKMGMFAS
jgi:hypothetical protein